MGYLFFLALSSQPPFPSFFPFTEMFIFFINTSGGVQILKRSNVVAEFAKVAGSKLYSK